MGCGGSKPTSPAGEAPANAGRAKLAAADVNGAAVDFKAAAKADPESSHGVAGAAAVLLARGELASAKRALEEARARGLAVDAAAPYLSAALAAWKPAAKASPQPTITAADRELAKRLNAGQYEEVIAAVRALKVRKPFHLRLLGDAFYNQKQWDHAVGAYRRALAQEPHNEPVAQYLADSLTRLRRFDEAISLYRALAENHPERPGFYRLIGDAAESKGDYEVALAAYIPCAASRGVRAGGGEWGGRGAGRTKSTSERISRR